MKSTKFVRVCRVAAAAFLGLAAAFLSSSVKMPLLPEQDRLQDTVSYGLQDTRDEPYAEIPAEYESTDSVAVPSYGTVDNVNPEILKIAKGDTIVMPKDGDDSICFAKDDRIVPFVSGPGRLEPRLRKSEMGEGIVELSLIKSDGTNFYCILVGEDGKVLTPMKYNYIEPFAEGLAVCCADYKAEGDDYIEITGHFGFLDVNGDEVIPMQYEAVRGFSEGLAAFSKDGKWGFIDKTGKIAIERKFTLNFLKREEYHHFTQVDNLFAEGLQAAATDKLFGYINTTGEYVIPPKWDAAMPFQDGVAAVVQGGYWHTYDGTSYQEGKWGLIDKTGREIIPPTYDDMYTFYNGIAVVQTVTEWQPGHMVKNVPKTAFFGAVNKEGKIVIPVVYDELRTVGMEHDIFLGVKNGKYSLLDRSGKTIVQEGQYDAIEYIGKDLFKAHQKGEAHPDNKGQIGDKVGIINSKGKVLVPLKYSKVEQTLLMFSGYMPGEFEVCLDGKWGIVNDKGDILEPIIYDRLEHMGITEDSVGKTSYIKGYIGSTEYVLRSVKKSK